MKKLTVSVIRINGNFGIIRVLWNSTTLFIKLYVVFYWSVDVSVMNIALPSQSEEKKRQDAAKNEGGKRKRPDWNDNGKNENQKSQALSNIQKAFEQHAQEVDQSSSYRVDKRVKISEKDEKGFVQNEDKEEKPYSDKTARTSASKIKDNEDEETPLRKLSISNFEPIQPKNKLSKSKSDTLPLNSST